ncbi:MAG: hypothetical protein KA715_14265 [Xanthomonadaceae bacterium]|nr:hypothetical protein [Xanthomonadaceae bacterium]
MSSKYFGAIALSGVNKVGQAYCPGDDEFPSFKNLGVVEFVDRVAEEIPEGDRGGLGIIFTLFGLMPQFLVTSIFKFLEWSWKKDVAQNLITRQIRLGLRGIAFSLYYSGLKGSQYQGKTPVELIGFSLNVVRT